MLGLDKNPEKGILDKDKENINMSKQIIESITIEIETKESIKGNIKDNIKDQIKDKILETIITKDNRIMFDRNLEESVTTQLLLKNDICNIQFILIY